MKDSDLNAELIIIGGGLAGLTSAIHLSKLGFRVLVIEKNAYPKHKVCGEYVSNEVLPYLNWLDFDPENLSPAHIDFLHFSTQSGESLRIQLPLGGFGVSRYALDYSLYLKAISQNCTVLKDQVKEACFKDDIFSVHLASGKTVTSSVVLGAFGKRSTLDQKMERKFFHQKSPWLAVKSHYKGDFPSDLVGLHHFKGGYCGVSKVEHDLINICYLTNFESFKEFKNIAEFQEKVVSQNPHLKAILNHAEAVSEKPLTISQISFAGKNTVENHVLMIGDTAGLIHPLCGNGMAMAIHSAKLASEAVSDFLRKKTSRAVMERTYQILWDQNFRKRMLYGRYLGKILEHASLSEILTKMIKFIPSILPFIIKKTHGKEILM
ncbi:MULTISPECIES: NAD(P)/FAD-dependent oxidoreductase [Chryseobacterium]|uniref:NAD(P)/FAD-dependent oxidoreductase n=1 Tax=Chryseobacterium sp. R2A-55 TaxID=2744445 RepID=UPI001F166C08|nr:NAD(P)/FAD-dependent oxidoreductase [Chryseobacterium sp. R2A-55]